MLFISSPVPSRCETGPPLPSETPHAPSERLLSRRRLLAAPATLTLAVLAMPERAAAQGLRLTAAAGEVRLGAADGPPTPFIGYDGLLPGPVLRAQRNAPLAIDLTNALAEPTGLHWQGLRDASVITRPDIGVGATQRHDLTPRDAGTFLYRPRLAGGEAQLRAGLAGLLIVADATPPLHDREVPLLLSEPPGGAVTSPDGLLVNGRPDITLSARPHERLWLRFANATASRILQWTVPDQRLTLVALDSQPCEPFPLDQGQLMLAPGQRAEVMWDVAAAAGTTLPIALASFAGTTLVGRMNVEGPPLRAAPLPPPAPLPPNPLPQAMDFRRATRIDLPIGALTFAGRSSRDAASATVLRLRRGAVALAAIRNDSAAFHAVHVEGHPARLLDGLDDGWKPFFLDTVIVAPGSTARIAFVAERAGRFRVTAQAINTAEGPLVALLDVG
jgi:FtsP/CotA-like multicopper oxidase with cupredoxin domain